MAKKKTTKKVAVAELPKPVKLDSRICFAIAYFLSEEDAMRYHAHVREKGYTYNGGYFHGMSCGRETKWDHEDENGRKLYAVTE